MDRTVHIYINTGEICRKFENPKFRRKFLNFKMTQNTRSTYPKIPKSDFPILSRKLRKLIINVPGPYRPFVFFRCRGSGGMQKDPVSHLRMPSQDWLMPPWRVEPYKPMYHREAWQRMHLEIS